MPTRYERIGVLRDPALDEALESVAPLVAATSAASLVHDLAIRGARALREEERRLRGLREELAEWSTGESEPPWDPDVLARVDELTTD